MNPFDQMYAGTPPWDVGHPQDAFVRLVEQGRVQGRTLDVGCGTGENALHCASTGLETWGIDLASRAIDRARTKAQARDLTVEFRVHDALHLGTLGTTFDTILDCGMFHTLSDGGRLAYEASLSRVARVGTTLHLLCFNEEEADWGGPRRVTRPELETAFAQRWVVESIDRARFQSRVNEDGAHAWLMRATYLGRRGLAS